MTAVPTVRVSLFALAAVALATGVVAVAGTTVLTPPAPPPTTGITPAVGGTTLLEALGLGGLVGGVVAVVVGIIITKWWRRPPRICRKCNCVRLPLSPTAGGVAPDDLQLDPSTGVELARHTCRYACSCETAGVSSTHTIWMTFPPPPVTKCPERLKIEVCWRGTAVEPPKITIE